ncbi:MAG: VOC family protein [Candidatus Korobacteraceae bacterium]
MIGKLTTIVLIVKDMDRSVAFYRDVLGLSVEMHSPFWSSLSAGNISLGLHPESAQVKAAPGMGCTFGFEVSDIQSTVQDLKAKSVKIQREPKHESFGWLAEIVDPDGYTVQLAQTEPWAQASNSGSK